jgi:hypothetical protein
MDKGYDSDCSDISDDEYGYPNLLSSSPNYELDSRKEAEAEKKAKCIARKTAVIHGLQEQFAKDVAKEKEKLGFDIITTGKKSTPKNENIIDIKPIVNIQDNKLECKDYTNCGGSKKRKIKKAKSKKRNSKKRKHKKTRGHKKMSRYYK